MKVEEHAHGILCYWLNEGAWATRLLFFHLAYYHRITGYRVLNLQHFIIVYLCIMFSFSWYRRQLIFAVIVTIEWITFPYRWSSNQELLRSPSFVSSPRRAQRAQEVEQQCGFNHPHAMLLGCFLPIIKPWSSPWIDGQFHDAIGSWCKKSTVHYGVAWGGQRRGVSCPGSVLPTLCKDGPYLYLKMARMLGIRLIFTHTE